MSTHNIIDITLEEARHWGASHYMEEGLLLTDHITKDTTSSEPLRMNFTLMALCIRGNAQYCIDTHEQTVEPGDLLFISERHLVSQYVESPDFLCQTIMVRTEFYHDFVQNVKNVSSLLLFSMNNPVVHLTPAEVQTYSNYFQTILEKMSNHQHPYRTELVKATLLAMFYDMSGVIYRVEQQDQKVQTRADAFFAKFIRVLEQNFRHERRVSWYAEQLNITPKYLSEVVKKTSKRTPTEWIDNYVILEARVLLKNSTKSIKEIADELHFANQSFLGKYFKEHTGMSPSEFRKS